MTATAQQRPERQQLRLRPKRATQDEIHQASDAYLSEAPIVAAVEPHTARVVGDTAAQLARELSVPLLFVTVRPRPPAMLGDRYYGRRLTRDLCRARKTLDTALAAASRHGVMSSGEILEGDAAARIVEFAIARHTQLLVVGQRRRRLRPSVSLRVTRASEQPVVIAVMPPARARTAPPIRRLLRHSRRIHP